MKVLNLNLIESYLSLLNHLSTDGKLELIARLSASMKHPQPESGKELNDLFGAYISSASADEIIASLQSNRIFQRTIENL
jgi:hypothetical protein